MDRPALGGTPACDGARRTGAVSDRTVAALIFTGRGNRPRLFCRSDHFTHPTREDAAARDRRDSDAKGVQRPPRKSRSVSSACGLCRQPEPATVSPQGPVGRASTSETGDDLRAALARRLPEYMIPAVVVSLETLPSTAAARPTGRNCCGSCTSAPPPRSTPPAHATTRAHPVPDPAADTAPPGHRCERQLLQGRRTSRGWPASCMPSARPPADSSPAATPPPPGVPRRTNCVVRRSSNGSSPTMARTRPSTAPRWRPDSLTPLELLEE